MPRLILAALIALLAGCGTVRVPPPYAEPELRARCERQGGWWHPDEGHRPFCEYQAPGMI